MCFSAPVSFLVAGGLTVVGGVSLRRARRRERILAVIPLLFAFQQALEGIQWLVARPSLLSDVAAYGFLFVALLVWPVYVPFVIRRLDSKRARLMRWILVIGIATASYFMWYLFTQTIAVEELSYGISYGLGKPYGYLAAIGYGISIVGALILSSNRFFRAMGFAVLASAIVAWAFFSGAFVSVWCLFAALLSGALYLYLSGALYLYLARKRG